VKEDLISNYKNNNELAIEDIVAQYSNYVYKIIKNISKNISNEDTEEILLDVFMAVWNNREKLKEELPLKPYIVGVTKNAIKNKSRNIKFTYDIEEYNIENFTDINEIIEQGEKNKIISKELNTMKQEDNKIFVLYYYNSMSIKEIANKLNSSETNIKTRLHRIRKRLKKALMEGGYGYGK